MVRWSKRRRRHILHQTQQRRSVPLHRDRPRCDATVFFVTDRDMHNGNEQSAILQSIFEAAASASAAAAIPLAALPSCSKVALSSKVGPSTLSLASSPAP